MKKIYILTYWSDLDKRPYIAKAYESRSMAISARDQLNADWEQYGRTYHIETIEVITKPIMKLIELREHK